MVETVANPHRKGILIIQIVLWIAVGLMFLGQFFFYLPVSLILTQPNTQPPMQPVPQVVFLAALIADCVLVIPAFLVLQHFVPRWLKRKGKSFGAQAASYIVFKLFAWMTAEGMGFFALVCCLIKHAFWPFLPFSILSLIFLAANPPLARVLKNLARSGGT